jgi:proteasome lid subunit RPN8/RPN11
MTLIHLPMDVVGRAITWAQIDSTQETVGFFVVNPGKIHVSPEQSGPYVEFKSLQNQSKFPERESEVAARDMAEMIVDHGLYPVAMFHSHPSGVGKPSEHDVQFFPQAYVDWGFIWDMVDPLVLTQYTVDGSYHQVQVHNIFIEVQP